MKSPHPFALILLATLLSAGCVTNHWVAKGVTGRVFDDQTGEALAGVVVFRLIDRDRVFVTTSESDGQFEVPALRKTIVEVPGPTGDSAYLAQLLFSKVGYEDQMISCATVTGDVYGAEAPLVRNATIRMKKKGDAQPVATDNPDRAS